MSSLSHSRFSAASERQRGSDKETADRLPAEPIASAALARTLGTPAEVSPGRLPVAASAIPAAPGPLDAAMLGDLLSMIGAARLDQLLCLLDEELDQRPRAVRAALADRDFAAAAAEAHNLAGGAGNLGALRVSEAARGLEQCIAAAATGDCSLLAPALRNLAAKAIEARQAVAHCRRAQLLEQLQA